MAEFFPLEACLHGLGELLQRTMGVQLQPVPFDAGESWAGNELVSKLAVLHDTDGLQGHVYLDLHPRCGPP